MAMALGIAMAVSVGNKMGHALAAYESAQKAMRYRNQIRQITEANNQNALTINSIWGEQDYRNKLLSSQLTYQNSAGTLAVQTAIMGFNGNTAEAVANSVRRASDLQTTNIEIAHQRAELRTQAQRAQLSWNTYTSHEYPELMNKPDYFGMALDSALGSYDAITAASDSKGSSSPNGGSSNK